MIAARTSSRALLILGFLAAGWSVMGANCDPDPVDYALQGESCLADDAICEPGSSCLEYYGFAGPAGPLFATCEFACGNDVDCPLGQQCGVISDGPGQVCVPEFDTPGEKCLDNVCGEGFYCCNKSCGLCAPDGGACIQIFCEQTE